MRKKNSLQTYPRVHLFSTTLGDPLRISQSLIGWGHKKITLLLALKALFSQDLITELLLELALKVQFSQGSVIQSLLGSQKI